MRKFFYIAFIAACFIQHAEAESVRPRITADIDRPKVTVGDRVKLTLKVEAPEGSRSIFPDLKEKIGGLDVKGIRRGPNTFEVALTSYTVGSFTLPPLSVKVMLPGGNETTLETLQLFVEVVSVAKKGDPMADVRDIKGVVSLPGLYLPPWGLLVGIFLLAALAGWALWRRKKQEAPPTPLSPHLVALEALDRLDTDLLFNRDVKEYHFQVSQILRRYLEERFGVKAPEQTTEEFLDASSKNHILNEAQKNLLKSFLEHCDLVKFAKLTPSSEEARRISHSARGFIHQTAPEAEVK